MCCVSEQLQCLSPLQYVRYKLLITELLSNNAAMHLAPSTPNRLSLRSMLLDAADAAIPLQALTQLSHVNCIDVRLTVVKTF
jgi:hypothetical protein